MQMQHWCSFPAGDTHRDVFLQSSQSKSFALSDLPWVYITSIYYDNVFIFKHLLVFSIFMWFGCF